MFQKENPGCASYSLYKTVMKEQNLKLHRPKKDKCGLCETYRKSLETEKAKIEKQYQDHRAEISEIQKIKDESKKRSQSTPSHASAVFDLQQNIYIPKSNRGELFYKRRLACFNFTIYELASHEGLCFLSNESISKRGACEVSTYLLEYLKGLDQKSTKTVDLFCDGCAGQNKNSLVIAMCHKFLTESTSVEEITFHFFETAHGQNEGDSMHSTIEKSLSQKEELSHPSQLHSVITEARQNPGPYKIRHVQTQQILGWKSYGETIALLKCRKTGDGRAFDWTKLKQVRITKQEDNHPTLQFKYSHLEEFVTLDLRRSLRSQDRFQVPPMPRSLYSERPKISSGKYNDLLSLCRGPFPVISQ